MKALFLYSNLQVSTVSDKKSIEPTKSRVKETEIRKTDNDTSITEQTLRLPKATVNEA